MKNSQIWLYCRFNKIVKGPGTSFQPLALNQKHHTAYQYLTKFHSDSI